MPDTLNDSTLTPPPPPPPPPPAVAAVQTVSQQSGLFWLGGLSAVLMIIGGFGPWATALNIVSVSGTRGDGWIVIGLAVFALAMLWLHAKRRARGPLIWAALAGAASAVLGLVDRANIADKGSGDLFGQHVQLVTPAWGIYMVIVASIALVIFSLALTGRSGPVAAAPPPAPPAQ